MKYLLAIFLTGIIFSVATAAIKIRNDENKQNPQTFKTISNTATTTMQIGERFTHFFDSEFLSQGVCLKIKDADGSGYTYLSTNKGTGIFSLTSCE